MDDPYPSSFERDLSAADGGDWLRWGFENSREADVDDIFYEGFF
jgi:hypothetical protein